MEASKAVVGSRILSINSYVDDVRHSKVFHTVPVQTKCVLIIYYMLPSVHSEWGLELYRSRVRKAVRCWIEIESE